MNIEPTFPVQASASRRLCVGFVSACMSASVSACMSASMFTYIEPLNRTLE